MNVDEHLENADHPSDLGGHFLVDLAEAGFGEIGDVSRAVDLLGGPDMYIMGGGKGTVCESPKAILRIGLLKAFGRGDISRKELEGRWHRLILTDDPRKLEFGVVERLDHMGLKKDMLMCLADGIKKISGRCRAVSLDGGPKEIRDLAMTSEYKRKLRLLADFGTGGVDRYNFLDRYVRLEEKVDVEDPDEIGEDLLEALKICDVSSRDRGKILCAVEKRSVDTFPVGWGRTVGRLNVSQEARRKLKILRDAGYNGWGDIEKRWSTPIKLEDPNQIPWEKLAEALRKQDVDCRAIWRAAERLNEVSGKFPQTECSEGYPSHERKMELLEEFGRGKISWSEVNKRW